MLLCLLKVLQGSWTEVKKKCNISRRILLLLKYSRGMTVGTKTSAAAGCLKHSTPSLLLTGKSCPPDFAFRSPVREQQCPAPLQKGSWDPTHGKVKELMVFLDALVSGASTTSTLHEPTCWTTASTAFLQPPGLLLRLTFSELFQKMKQTNMHLEKSFPSFSVELFLLFPHSCHLHFAQLVWHKPSKSSEAHLSSRLCIISHGGDLNLPSDCSSKKWRISLDKHGWVVPFLCNNSQFYRPELCSCQRHCCLQSPSEAGSSHSCSPGLLQPGQGHCSLLQSVRADLAIPLNAGLWLAFPMVPSVLRAKTLSQSISVSSQEQS